MSDRSKKNLYAYEKEDETMDNSEQQNKDFFTLDWNSCFWTSQFIWKKVWCQQKQKKECRNMTQPINKQK